MSAFVQIEISYSNIGFLYKQLFYKQCQAEIVEKIKQMHIHEIDMYECSYSRAYTINQ